MTVEIKVPDMGESVIEATVAHWLKAAGEAVLAGEPLVELETDKINLEVSAPKAGILEAIERAEGEIVQVGDVLGRVAEREGAAQPVNESQPAAETPARAPATEPGGPKVTPLAQRMAKDHGIDLEQLTPSGSGGRITKQDVQAAMQKAAPAAESQPAASTPARPSANLEGRPEKRVRMSRRRQTIARRLVEAQRTAAMLTTFNEIDMSRVIELRKRQRAGFQERFGVDLGYMSFFVKAAIGALQGFPALNAEIQGDEIVYKEYYDIGIAVGAEEGLVVPVLRDADRMSFAEIERAIRGFSEKVKSASLTLDDLRGGTFTITNGGVYGSLLSTPILNPPQVGILGMHAIQTRPVGVNGEIVLRPMMYVALSYDHRMVDGREAVQFLVRVKSLVEDPESLLLLG